MLNKFAMLMLLLSLGMFSAVGCNGDSTEEGGPVTDEPAVNGEEVTEEEVGEVTED